jgi:hypothetical protein
MEALIGIVLLLGLLAWILFDMRQLRRKPFDVRHKATEASNAAAESRQARYFLWGLSCAIYLLAVVEWLHPRKPPFTGRMSSIEAALYYSFGPKAVAMFWAAFASVFALWAFFKKAGQK